MRHRLKVRHHQIKRKKQNVFHTLVKPFVFFSLERKKVRHPSESSTFLNLFKIKNLTALAHAVQLNICIKGNWVPSANTHDFGGRQRGGRMKQGMYALIALIIVSGCTNRSIQTTSGGSSSTDFSGITSTNSANAVITLVDVVRSSTDPTAAFDLIGQNDQFESFCLSTDSGSTCQCEYEYDDQKVKVDTTYNEKNLIRCPYTIIPATTTSTIVRVVVTTTGAISNDINYTFDQSLNGDLDLSDASSYREVKRYQCRPYVTVPYMFDNSVYDPFQSELDTLTYPLNFYTASKASSIFAMAEQSGSNPAFFGAWECEFGNLNSSTMTFPWRNPRVFSVASMVSVDVKLYNDSTQTIAAAGPAPQLIDGPTPSDLTPFDRNSFLAARTKTGLFSFPIHTYIAPGIRSQSPNAQGVQAAGTYAPPGYLARSIPTADGERCPNSDEVQIPIGYHWVKVWAFRAALQPRAYVAGADDVAYAKAIACNPGNWEDPEAGSTAEYGLPVFKDCRTPGQGQPGAPNFCDNAGAGDLENGDGSNGCRYQLNGTVGGGAGNDLFADFSFDMMSDITFGQLGTTDRMLVDRVIGTSTGKNACFRFEGHSFGTVNPNRLDNTGGPAGAAPGDCTLANCLSGTDSWVRVGGSGAVADASVPFNLTGSAGSSSAAHQDDNSKIYTSPIDAEDRPDYLLVTSPETVMLNDMEQRVPGNINTWGPFTPFTYKRARDCDSNDAQVDCSDLDDIKMKVNYELIKGEIGVTDGATGSNDGVFPLCGIQPTP